MSNSIYEAFVTIFDIKGHTTGSSFICNMEDEEHRHSFIFNDDGFQVCKFCGICTTLREYSHNLYHDDLPKFWSVFSDVLINYNLGYVDQIEKEYKKLKMILCRGYPNIALYAYCTYIVLLQEGIYYSLGQISIMFQILNFSKLFCQIEKNHKVKRHSFNVKNETFIESSLCIFLSQYNSKHQLSRAVDISKVVKQKHRAVKHNFLVAISLYFTLEKTFVSRKELFEVLSTYFSINVRTLKSHLKDVSKTLQTQ